MPLRTRIILVAAGVVVIALLWFLFLWRPAQNRIGELREQQQAARDELDQLRARLRRLQQLQADEPRLLAELARLEDALPTDPRVPDFILQVQEAANLASVDFLSISPSVPAAFTPPGAQSAGAAPSPIQAISVTIATTGQFFELEDFIVRMERLARAVRINSFSLGGGAAEGGRSPTMNVSFQMQMFVAGAPPAPGSVAAPTPAPAATPTPSPGASPAPGVPTPSPAG